MGARRGAGALHMADGLNPPGICGTIWGGGHGLSPWEDGLAREGQLRLEMQRGRPSLRLERASGHVAAGREKCNRGCMDGWGGNRQGTAWIGAGRTQSKARKASEDHGASWGRERGITGES